MRNITLWGVALIAMLAFASPVHAQGKLVGKALQVIGKAAHGKAGKKAVTGARVASGAHKLHSRSVIKVRIENNTYYTRYIQISEDGTNWTRYNLAPGYYVEVKGRAGRVAACGVNCYSIHEAGTYSASVF